VRALRPATRVREKRGVARLHARQQVAQLGRRAEDCEHLPSGARP